MRRAGDFVIGPPYAKHIFIMLVLKALIVAIPPATLPRTETRNQMFVALVDAVLIAQHLLLLVAHQLLSSFTGGHR